MVRKRENGRPFWYGINYPAALRNFITVDNTVGTVPGINLVGSGGTGVQYTPSAYTSLSNVTLPIPLPPGTQTTVPFVIPTTDRSLTISTYNRTSPYIQNWNLEIQREIAHNTTVEVRYLGTKGTKLWGNINLNQVDALHHNRDLYDAFNAVRAGGESALLNQMLSWHQSGWYGCADRERHPWTGAMAVRANTTLRPLIANGSAGAFVNQLNTLATGTGVSTSGAILRRADSPRITSCPTLSSRVFRCWTTWVIRHITRCRSSSPAGSRMASQIQRRGPGARPSVTATRIPEPLIEIRRAVRSRRHCWALTVRTRSQVMAHMSCRLEWATTF